VGTQTVEALAPAVNFYRTTAWRRLRWHVLVRDGFRCVVCGADVGSRGAARVDHILPRKSHPHLELDPSNCRTLCTTHDNQAHREKRTRVRIGANGRIERFNTAVGVDGWPIDKTNER
jgi:5-methylcytosine-specific restriction endonuclease McrA